MPNLYFIAKIIILLVLLGLSVFFSGSETGFSSLNRIKLKTLAERNKKAGKKRKAARVHLALRLLDNYDNLLSSVLIGNTVVNIAASSLATVLFFDLFGAKGASIAAISLTFIILLFCEITPKTLAAKSPENTAVKTAGLLRLFTVIFFPLNFIAGMWKKILVRIFPQEGSRLITEEELLSFVEEARNEGGINRHEERMIKQVIEFDDITAAEICTPRADIAAVSQECTIQEINRVFAETSFSRLPVYRDSVDNITGVILLKDFYYEAIEKKKPVKEIIKPVLIAAKTMKISKLLKTLQKKKSYIAVLVDEYGGTTGIVTIEDIIEELVGEIWDEHDDIVEHISQIEVSVFTVLGSVQFQEIFEYIAEKTGFNFSDYGDIPEDAISPAATIGSWIMENSAGLPHEGDTFRLRNLHITVTKVQRQRIMEVKINLRSEPTLW